MRGMIQAERPKEITFYGSITLNPTMVCKIIVPLLPI